MIVLGAVAYALLMMVLIAGVSWSALLLFGAPQVIAARRRDRLCVTCRGEVAAILAMPDDVLCRAHHEQVARIQSLESAMDRPLPPPSMADPSLVAVIWR